MPVPVHVCLCMCVTVSVFVLGLHNCLTIRCYKPAAV